MPVIKSAIKKLRQDRKHEKHNDIIRNGLKKALRDAKRSKNGKSVAKAISTIDKASKNNIIHKNKASRLKSKLTKLSKPVSVKTATKTQKPSTKVVKKTSKEK